MKTNLPKYFMVSETDGGLYDTRKQNWAANPVRPNYCRTRSRINSLADVKSTLRAGGFTFPGFYPMFLITSDGAALCFDCAKKQFRQIAWDFQNKCSTGWRVCATDINYESEDLYCDHCSQKIDSAYGDNS